MGHHVVHPGEILAEELETLGITPTEFARQIHVPANRISQIIHGKRAITGDTALRFAHWFKTTPERWLGLQLAYDLSIAERNAGAIIRRLPTRTGKLQRTKVDPHLKKFGQTG